MSNSQSRIVLRNGALIEANRILELTGKNSISELVSDLIYRYGAHFADTWRYTGCKCNHGDIEMQRPKDNRFVEQYPILQPVPIEDLATNLDEPLNF